MMDIEKYRRKSRIYTENLTIRVSPEIKQRIENLKPHIEMADILRDKIRDAVAECELKIKALGA